MIQQAALLLLSVGTFCVDMVLLVCDVFFRHVHGLLSTASVCLFFQEGLSSSGTAGSAEQVFISSSM